MAIGSCMAQVGECVDSSDLVRWFRGLAVVLVSPGSLRMALKPMDEDDAVLGQLNVLRPGYRRHTLGKVDRDRPRLLSQLVVSPIAGLRLLARP